MQITKEEKNLAVVMHLSILSGLIIPLLGLIIPIIIWILKKSESSYIDEQGKEIINFIINILIAGLFIVILSFVIIGLVLLIPYALYVIVAPIIAAVKCSEGNCYKYPFIFRFIN